MDSKAFDYKIADSQATRVEPVKYDAFDYDAWHKYEEALVKHCESFRQSDSGVLVYRRMRCADVFSYGCSNMKLSLELQLGALQKSMDYKADVPNFLEPWYGIGTIASAYGAEYIWNPGQAPAVHPRYDNIDDISDNVVSVHETPIGRHTLEMIDYFLEKTKRNLPMSFCDIQSPLNIAMNVVNISNFLMSLYIDPERVMQFLDNLSILLIGFTEKQKEIIGENIVCPGHGFASCRIFKGFGMSDDNIVMLPEELYKTIAAPSFEKTGNVFDGPAFHSCGNWSDKLEIVKNLRNLTMVDAAFSPQTDPDPNPAELFREKLSNTGIVLNARIVGESDVIEEQVKKLWSPGMKLIVVTYCKTPEEQEKAYNIVHEICS